MTGHITTWLHLLCFSALFHCTASVHSFQAQNQIRSQVFCTAQSFQLECSPNKILVHKVKYGKKATAITDFCTGGQVDDSDCRVVPDIVDDDYFKECNGISLCTRSPARSVADDAIAKGCSVVDYVGGGYIELEFQCIILHTAEVLELFTPPLGVPRAHATLVSPVYPELTTIPYGGCAFHFTPLVALDTTANYFFTFQIFDFFSIPFTSKSRDVQSDNLGVVCHSEMKIAVNWPEDTRRYSVCTEKAPYKVTSTFKGTIGEPNLYLQLVPKKDDAITRLWFTIEVQSGAKIVEGEMAYNCTRTPLAAAIFEETGEVEVNETVTEDPKIQDDDASTNSNDKYTWIIIGATTGICCLIIILAVICLLFRRQAKRKRMAPPPYSESEEAKRASIASFHDHDIRRYKSKWRKLNTGPYIYDKKENIQPVNEQNLYAQPSQTPSKRSEDRDASLHRPLRQGGRDRSAADNQSSDLDMSNSDMSNRDLSNRDLSNINPPNRDLSNDRDPSADRSLSPERKKRRPKGRPPSADPRSRDPSATKDPSAASRDPSPRRGLSASNPSANRDPSASTDPSAAPLNNEKRRRKPVSHSESKLGDMSDHSADPSESTSKPRQPRGRDRHRPPRTPRSQPTGEKSVEERSKPSAGAGRKPGGGHADKKPGARAGARSGPHRQPAYDDGSQINDAPDDQ